ncbi:PAN2-PAN3 deadenylation complex catalytic subunit PAN2-like isoform X3 [Daphnia carinata]|uniref:PAN2-PAN3 deadenylation complex catalytic subunit PAN2-like isoform X3 n=1 Tax=Daphnia carinata TaxID=120202 RepID=UPI00257D68F1|nr:PAN2-PAN3 deadenylation complex catalytic subunit PAN2-like isoform X3 [Daphnia carinata]
MDFNVGVFTEKSSILIDGGDRFGVSAIHWDFQEELLWVGNQGGHVTSYYGSSLHKYTSFQVHASQEVRHMVSLDAGLLIITPNTLRCQQRRGVPLFSYSSNNFEDLQCVLQLGQTKVLLGGHQPLLVEFDLITAKETTKFDVGEKGCAILRHHPRFICSGDASGSVSLRDPRTLREEHRFVAHTESLSDFDVHNNLVVTCGFSSRLGGVVPDRFLKIYDVRMLRSLSPVSVVGEPFLLRFLPAFSSQLAVISAMGQLQILDAAAPAASALQLFQVNNEGAMCMALEVSSSCQCLAVGDAGGYVHTFASNASALFNSFSRPTEFADPVESLPVSISMDDTTTPFTSIPFPLKYSEPLLSDWPEQFTRRKFRKVPPIDHAILANMRMVGTIGYAPSPAGHRPNQVSYSTEKQTQRGQKHSGSDSTHSKDTECYQVWKRYRHIEMRYTKGGLDENELARYNSTPLCGLDNTLPYSYANSLLQVLYFIPDLRRILLEHCCNREFCLACELSFLFHMLDVGRNQDPNGQPVTVQPSNFLRAFRTLPEASAMGLLVAENHPEIKIKSTLPRLAQSWARFILQQLSSETLPQNKIVKESALITVAGLVEPDRDGTDYSVKCERDLSPSEDGHSPVSPISKLFGVEQEQTSRCTKCGSETSKTSLVLLSSLTLQDLEGVQSFENVLEKSFDVTNVTPAWCDVCQKYQITQQRRRCLALPPVLALSCGNDTYKGFRFWSDQLQYLLDPEVADGCDSTESQSQLGQGKPCRYGLECTRPNCKFGHGGQPMKHSASFTGISSNHWVPSELHCKVQPEGGLVCVKPNESPDEFLSYSLVAAVCWIDESKLETKHQGKWHLVSTVQIPPDYLSPKRPKEEHESSNWFVFNDFAVNPITPDEAISFFPDWKLPCLLFYSKDVANGFHLTDHPSNPITADVFKEDKSLAQKSEGLQRISFLPLATDEMPGKGDLVAMDAEFVTLNQEEAELRSDGKSTTVRPSQMSVARVTVIRGVRSNGLSWTSVEYPRQGNMEGLPFIDDYIATQDQVVDYLTKFSGIQPGDLDIASSSKHLTTLKSTYMKLRFLVDNGVTFVGHGLKNDFRVINLLVPSSQVIDTVHLFHLPHQRMISLRFLAWHFLDLKIQSVTHDSVEDARTALRLYRRYQELKAKGDDFLHESLQELYSVGRRLQWMVPGLDEE